MSRKRCIEVKAVTDTDLLRKSLAEFQGQILLDEPMSLHTSFKLGGPADVFAVPENVEDLQVLLRCAQSSSLPVFVLGGGTNLLVADRGIRGLVVQLGRGFRRVHIRGRRAAGGAAAKLSRVVRQSIGRGLAGVEALQGIPGTVGGAICMNAGTPEGCVKDSLEAVTALDAQGELHKIPACDLGLDYRGSAVRRSGLVITDATFRLREEEPAQINKIVESLMSKRRHTQPYGIGTAGSVFKNPPGKYAGQILETVGAKGMQIGGARVSSKHANFIENTGNASAADVRELMLSLQHLAADKFGVTLEPEIELVGEW